MTRTDLLKEMTNTDLLKEMTNTDLLKEMTKTNLLKEMTKTVFLREMTKTPNIFKGAKFRGNLAIFCKNWFHKMTTHCYKKGNLKNHHIQ